MVSVGRIREEEKSNVCREDLRSRVGYDDDEVAELVEVELAAGTDPQKMLEEALVAALDTVGAQFSAGGPLVTDDFAAKIGADGYGVDAPGAVELARGFVY